MARRHQRPGAAKGERAVSGQRTSVSRLRFRFASAPPSDAARLAQVQQGDARSYRYSPKDLA